MNAYINKKTTTGKFTSIFTPVIPALITFGIIYFVFFFLNIAPFGNNTIAIDDADIQYLDFFGFYKDVLNGENSISYSYSNYLGGGTIGVFSYYLASPVNFLVLFFDKTNLVGFYHLATAIKLSLCAMSFAIFLKVRFENRITPLFSIMLSVSFALMNYNLVQSKNIMWLDGVYMLPFIVLGIYKIISGKSIIWFSVPLALSMIFNWYTGGINLIFSIIWFVFELLICSKAKRWEFKHYIVSILKYIYSLITSVLLSMALLLPVLFNLNQGRGSKFDWEYLSPDFNGNIISILPKFSLGANDTTSAFSIYCGALVITGVLLFFATGFIRIKHKIVAAVALSVAILLLYWQPLFFIFSLFKKVDSYQSRYSYISVFILIFIAAVFFANIVRIKNKSPDKRKIIIFLILIASFEAVFVISSLIMKDDKSDHMILTAIITGIIALLVIIFIKSGSNKIVCNVSLLLLVCTVVFNLAINTYIQYDSRMSDTVNYISAYTSNVQMQLSKIKDDADDTYSYRINRSFVRSKNDPRNNENTTNGPKRQSNYDEAFSYGYNGISGYTSCPDNNQLVFLSYVGYNSWAHCVTIVNDTNIVADTILGAGYITTFQPIKGLLQLDYNEYTGYLYKNPYAFPLAFKADPSFFEYLNINNKETETFEYQSLLLKKLSGVEKEIYTPIKYSEKRGETSILYNFEDVEESTFIYGKIHVQNDTLIKLTDDYSIEYFGWLTPKIFRILPNNKNDNVTEIELETKDASSVGKAFFYTINDNVLKEMSEKAAERSANNIKMTHNSFSCDIDGNDGELLFTSLPFSKGIEVKINNKTVEPVLIEKTLMCLPLEEGQNNITVNYNIPYLNEGIIITIIGIGLIICYQIFIYVLKRR